MQPTNSIIATSGELTLAEQIRQLGLNLGLQAVHFSSPSTDEHELRFQQWLDAGHHGEMDWLQRNKDKRFHGGQLHPGTKTVISVRMDYLPDGAPPFNILSDPNKAYVARYAVGRDYHKVLRKRLTLFAKQIAQLAGEHGYRPFVDSAPVMERQLAEKSGMGWIGKNTLLLAPGAGSWFFLGELFTDLELPFDEPFEKNHCGSCQECLVKCPTDAFTQAGVLDARKCISYLTIEYSGSIPVDLRSKMGNRIYGCDDCQLVCPHNNKADTSAESDFTPRHQLDQASLTDLFSWDETTFLSRTEGSPIRRIGYQQWLRNIAIALGNGEPSHQVIQLLSNKLGCYSELLDEHLRWAIEQLEQRLTINS
ncbi:tRNA epoxyqueuosine(34) reductase QueG [Reinekea thalattae]|uniref:Epoxyqueuosine reductase n=1 Tax=Reinekea thalattae TaxID=2593301 RepID=A0A5C8Z7Q9_9GAMM|nr:tRNA epoxyqueuosine(34) reductase QueG [Reinekea thalattae]TXR54125.1 tRNA epoxyqueuosine(34) reductase QueG [Reinekea thalattae]